LPDRHGFVKSAVQYGAVILGGAVFALGFNLFLLPNRINAGGLSGLSQLLVQLLGVGSVGLLTAMMNVPLFLLGLRRLGRRFFFLSLLGMAASTAFLEVFSYLPAPRTELLTGALAGGILCGAGIGLVFSRGATTGGADLIARLLREKLPSMSLGRLILFVDLAVIALTGVVFRDWNRTIYSALTLSVSSFVVDKLLYGPDVSAVALIVSERYEAIADAVGSSLHRGVTVLSARGYHTGQARPVLLCAVRRGQIAALRTLVTERDPEAFVILQEAHQVLGRGFRRDGGNL